MNPTNLICDIPRQESPSRGQTGRRQVFPLVLASLRPKIGWRQHLLAAGLTLGLVALSQTAPAQTLVGEWLDGSAASTNFLDVSGYSLAANHSATLIGAGTYAFTNDVPPGKTGKSILFYAGDTGLAISNSSTLDANYDNTFDNGIATKFTVSCWSKTFPGTWQPWVSKYGELPGYTPPGSGWQLRAEGSDPYACFTVRNYGGGTNFINPATTKVGGLPPYDDMYTYVKSSADGAWHHYAGVFDSSTGVRQLYVDGSLVANETAGNIPYFLEPTAHLCINAKDSPPGSTFDSFSTAQIYDVRIYDYPLTASQVQALYGNIPPTISGPSSAKVSLGKKTQLVTSISGASPLAYQWRFNGTNVNLLTDSANFTGGNSNVLTILSVSSIDLGSYQLIVTNLYGSATSSVATISAKIPALVGRWITGSDDFNDVSGFKPGLHNGALIGAGGYGFVNDVPDGTTGDSIYFDGSSGLSISNSATGDAAYTNTFDSEISEAFTTTAWVKGPISYGSWFQYLTKNSSAAGWGFGSSGQNPEFHILNGGGVVTVGEYLFGYLRGKSPVPSGWHFYAGVYSSVTGTTSLYEDGALVAKETGVGPYTQAPSSHLCIGAQQTAGIYNTFFDSASQLYDIRVYNYDLSQIEVIQIMPPTAVVITTGPQSKTIPPGQVVSFSVVATGSVTNYQWQAGPVGSGVFTNLPVSGIASSVLTISNTFTVGQADYRVIVNGTINSVTSAPPATLTVMVNPYSLPPVTSGLVLRVDASQLTGVTQSNVVSTWTDTSDAANHAVRQSGSSAGYPMYVTNVLNGKPVVRFNSGNANTGDYFKFPRITAIRTVFWVLKENAGLSDCHFLLGDDSSYDFHREYTINNGPLWNATYASGNITGGTTKLMGNVINGTTTSLPSGSFQVVSLVTVGNVQANQICQDRTSHGSWQGDIAEILIYDRALTTNEENQVGYYLGTKYGLTTTYTPAPPTPTITGFTGPVAGQFTFTGTASGPGNIVTEKATSLTPPIIWVPIQTNAVSAGAFSIAIPQGAGSQAFYRLMGQ